MISGVALDHLGERFRSAGIGPKAPDRQPGLLAPGAERADSARHEMHQRDVSMTPQPGESWRPGSSVKDHRACCNRGEFARSDIAESLETDRWIFGDEADEFRDDRIAEAPKHRDRGTGSPSVERKERSAPTPEQQCEWGGLTLQPVVQSLIRARVRPRRDRIKLS